MQAQGQEEQTIGQEEDEEVKEEEVKVNPILLQHAFVLQAKKPERAKLITQEFAEQLHEIDADFKAFSQTGIAAKISSLTSCYSMYVNVLDRQPDKKRQIIDSVPTGDIVT